MKEVVSDEEVFRFLDVLRDSGETNMLASPNYLKKEFGMSFEKAVEKFQAWAEQLERKED